MVIKAWIFSQKTVILFMPVVRTGWAFQRMVVKHGQIIPCQKMLQEKLQGSRLFRFIPPILILFFLPFTMGLRMASGKLQMGVKHLRCCIKEAHVQWGYHKVTPMLSIVEMVLPTMGVKHGCLFNLKAAVHGV